MYVILDNIRSVYNVASIFRTADAVGVGKIFLCGITPTPLTPLGSLREDFHKVALGAESFVPWEYSSRTIYPLRRLKKDKMFIMALEQAATASPYWVIRKNKFNWERSVLILGNEPKGIGSGVLRKADRIIEIPMLGKKESLNVSVAFGIVVCHLRFVL